MEQAKRKRAHLERIMLVCGMPNAGKSRLIRHMFGDLRLGGVIPSNGPLSRRALSRDRCLAGRATSPHEAVETPAEFLQKIDDACASAWPEFRRINYISAVQPKSRNHMQGIVTVCQGLITAFHPERIRVVQLFPDQWGEDASRLGDVEIDGLRQLDVEVVALDARRSVNAVEPGNVRILADYFDFS
jgi:hypothetical protein